MSSRSVCRSDRSTLGGGEVARPARRRAALGLSILLVLASSSWAGLAGAEPDAGAVAAAAAMAEPNAAPAAVANAEPIVLAQEGGTTPRELEPRYPAPEPGRPGPYNDQEREVWNSDYVFGITRSLVKSTIVPAGKAPLFLFTVPLDIAFLPFALIGGFFG